MKLSFVKESKKKNDLTAFERSLNQRMGKQSERKNQRRK